jgi:hypothetical protein
MAYSNRLSFHWLCVPLTSARGADNFCFQKKNLKYVGSNTDPRCQSRTENTEFAIRAKRKKPWSVFQGQACWESAVFVGPKAPTSKGTDLFGVLASFGSRCSNKPAFSRWHTNLTLCPGADHGSKMVSMDLLGCNGYCIPSGDSSTKFRSNPSNPDRGCS